ncbi:MAG: cytochrome D1 domain-containing protein [Bryobacteraceae bacterium]
MPKPLSSYLPLPFLFLGALAMSAATPSLLVINQGDADMSIVNPESGQQVAVVSEEVHGVHAHEVVASANGRTAFLPIYGSSGVGRPGIDGHQILVVDLPSRKIVDRIDFSNGVRPHCIKLNPRDGLLYVTTEIDHTVTIINPKTRKIVGSIPTGAKESHMLAISRDGRRGYTANVGAGSVSELDLVHRKVIAVVPVAKVVQRIAVSNDGKLAFTSDQIEPRLAVIDTKTHRVKTWVPLAGTGYGAAPTHDGRYLLVAIPHKNEVAVVDLHSMKVARSVPVPKSPQEILIRPDGKVAYVSCAGAKQVAAIDLADWKVAKTIDVGRFDDGLAWAK